MGSPIRLDQAGLPRIGALPAGPRSALPPAEDQAAHQILGQRLNFGVTVVLTLVGQTWFAWTQRA